MSDPDPAGLSRQHYAAIAAFRFELRRFLAFSEQAAAGHGLPAQQHQALLAIAGHLGPRGPTVGLVAEQLMIAPASAVELVSRMVAAGLLSKRSDPEDRRRAVLEITAAGESVLRRLTHAHLQELRVLEPALARALRRLARSHPLAREAGAKRGLQSERRSVIYDLHRDEAEPE
jgi:DNA-binding MarR family transcriptional regulator